MKRIIYIFFPLFVSLVSWAQDSVSLNSWAERLRLFGEKIPQEEIFLHTDNTCYYLGDTLYFKAYMRLSNGQPSNLSRLLYVELLNHDGYLVERQKIEMKDGQGFGSFCLPDTLYGGYYELRAYTRWQLNWGQTEHPHTRNAERWFHSRKMARDYYRDYEKLYSRVFPVYDAPRELGDYAQDMTMRPLRRVYKQQDEKPHAEVRFYPEGGNLVLGVPNRIAFEANDEEGRHLKGKIKIQNPKIKIRTDQSKENNDEIEVETMSRGRGVLVLSAEDCTAETFDELAENTIFQWGDNVQKVNLPKAVEDGVAIQANVESDGIHVVLYPHGIANHQKLGITASCHGIQCDFQVVDGSYKAFIPNSKLPSGVIQLTVFNDEGRVYSDRLVFVRQLDFQPQSITFSGIKPKYEQYEQAEITVMCSATQSPNTESTISLAIRDAAHSDYTFDSGNILTEMLLSSQIRGFVEQPEYFFESDDEEHRTALDLLLMVQGWRRYDWVEMATPGAFAVTQPYERTEILMGEVNSYDFEEQANSIMEEIDRQEAQYEKEQEELASRQENHDSDISEATTGENVITEMEESRDQRYSADETGQGTHQKMNSIEADKRQQQRYREGGNLRNEAMLHAEFLQPGVKENGAVVGEMETYNNGAFKIESPKFYEACYMSLAAVSKKQYKGDAHIWVDVNEDKDGRLNYPEYYVKLNPIYPRFVKPYSFYQQHLPTIHVRAGKLVNVDENTILMDEITIGARRNGLRRFDASKPAFVLDAYEAFNDVSDAGFCPAVFYGAQRFANDVARTYIGDMNMERAYNMELRYNTRNASYNISPGIKEQYNHLPNLDKVYVYTDYSPRREGDRKFSHDNQPGVIVDLRRYEDNSQRMTWRDRRFTLTGFAVCEDFYQPDYSQRKPAEPKDYRRTLYWNPNLQLSSDGKAKVSFFTGSRSVQVTVSAEGMTFDGQPLTGISYPEDR